MCKHTKSISKDFQRLGEIAIQTLRKNQELEHYNVIGHLSIEGTKDIIYVSDIETSEVLFMNSNAIEVFGDGLGKKCYDVFHKGTQCIKHCNNDKLLKHIGAPINWVFFNEYSKELYYITDVSKKVEGRILRFERATPLNGLTKEIVKLSQKYNLI